MVESRNPFKILSRTVIFVLTLITEFIYPFINESCICFHDFILEKKTFYISSTKTENCFA